MRPMFGTIGTSPSYPSTAPPVIVRRITTGGREVSHAGSVATGESGKAFAAYRGSLFRKVCRGGASSGEWGAGSEEPEKRRTLWFCTMDLRPPRHNCVALGFFRVLPMCIWRIGRELVA
jgi:hypothetical protein